MSIQAHRFEALLNAPVRNGEVDLGGRDIAVAQNFLELEDREIVFDHFPGEGVAKHMGREFHTCFPTNLAAHGSDVLGPQSGLGIHSREEAIATFPEPNLFFEVALENGE